MEKRNEVRAVYAESLVFGSNFGLAEGLATGLDDEVSKRAPSIPEAACDAEKSSAGGAKMLLIGDPFWPAY